MCNTSMHAVILVNTRLHLRGHRDATTILQQVATGIPHAKLQPIEQVLQEVGRQLLTSRVSPALNT